MEDLRNNRFIQGVFVLFFISLLVSLCMVFKMGYPEQWNQAINNLEAALHNLTKN